MHEQWQESLLYYVSGTLSNEERQTLEEHLTECPECRAVAEEWRALAQVASAEVEALKDKLPPLVLPGSSRFAPRGAASLPNHKPDRMEERKMSFSTVLRLPAQPRRLSPPLTLIAALAFTLLVGGILLFNRIPSLSTIFSPPLFQDGAFMAYINEVWNAGKFAVLDDILAPEFTHHDAALAAPVADQDTLIAYVEQFRSNLPGVTFTYEPPMEQALAKGEFMFYTHLTVSGDGFTVPLTASAHVSEGKLAEVWFDANALLETQLAKRFRHMYEEIWNNPDVSLSDLRESWHDSFTGHDLRGETLIESVPADILPYIRAWQQSFPDLECSVSNAAVEGVIVLLQYTCGGTFENKIGLPGFGGFEPTGERTEWDGMDMFRLENGKIIEYWTYVDNPFLWRLCEFEACS